MIWRTSYSTKSAENLDLPNQSDPGALTDGVYVAAFDLAAHGQQQIWIKLLESDFTPDSYRLLLIKPAWSKSAKREAEEILPPSRLTKTIFATDPDSNWESLIQPDGPGRAFAFVIKDQRIKLLMVGPPTEEAWDEFKAAIES